MEKTISPRLFYYAVMLAGASSCFFMAFSGMATWPFLIMISIYLATVAYLFFDQLLTITFSQNTYHVRYLLRPWNNFSFCPSELQGCGVQGDKIVLQLPSRTLRLRKHLFHYQELPHQA